MLQDLDPKLINALDELRREFDDKLSRQRQEFERLVGATSTSPEVEPEPVAVAEPPAVAHLDPLEELKLAAAEIDGAESQADVLDALIRGTSRFSSRSAVFLCRDGALYGWGGTGFGQADSAIKDMVLECPEGSPWEQVNAGEGGICLSTAECSLLTDRLDAGRADLGLLVPFILRQQVAAVVYADRRQRDSAFNISGLQLLSFLAGQTVETLPIRERTATSSLQLAVAPVTVEAEVEVEQQTAAEPETAVESATEPEPEPEESPEPAAEEWGGPAAAAPPIEMPAEIPVETPVEIPPEVDSDILPELPLAEPEAAPELESPALDEAPAIGVPDLSPAPPIAPVVETEPEPAAVGGPPPSLATPDVHPVAEPAEPPNLTSTQVQPPQDVEGPGWAFTTTRIPTSAGVEALHEEARRLARLLVTEIKLYNEELVEEGRQAGDVYSRLREDIDRSRQIFDDRIEPEVRNEKDYFREALVRILAGGDPGILGISD